MPRFKIQNKVLFKIIFVNHNFGAAHITGGNFIFANVEMLGGFAYEIHIGDEIFYFIRQGFALLALIPIWLYRGRQGYHNKVLQYFYYAFYPIHLLILGIIK